MTLTDPWPGFQGHGNLKSNIGKTKTKDKVIIAQEEKYLTWNGTIFGDLDWPLNASRGFVSISWAYCCACYIVLYCNLNFLLFLLCILYCVLSALVAYKLHNPVFCFIILITLLLLIVTPTIRGGATFLPARRYASAVLAVERCPSVRHTQVLCLND